MVMHRKERFLACFGVVMIQCQKAKKKKTKQFELQKSDEFVPHLQHDNLGFPSHGPQLPPVKFLLISVDWLAGGQ